MGVVAIGGVPEGDRQEAVFVRTSGGELSDGLGGSASVRGKAVYEAVVAASKDCFRRTNPDGDFGTSRNSKRAISIEEEFAFSDSELTARHLLGWKLVKFAGKVDRFRRRHLGGRGDGSASMGAVEAHGR